MSKSKVKLIGLMLTYENQEVLDSWLKCHHVLFDRIFNLDGSLKYKKTIKNIIKKYENVVNYDQSDFEISEVTDGSLRGILYEEIKMYIEQENLKHDKEYDYWICICHPDEFYIENILELANYANESEFTIITAKNLHVCPLTSEYDVWIKFKSFKIFNHFLYPGFSENRIFKFDSNAFYRPKRHSRVIPVRYLERNCDRTFKTLHYKIINPGKHLKLEANWSGLGSHFPDKHEFTSPKSFFLDKPAGKYKSNTLMSKKELLVNNEFVLKELTVEGTM